MSHEHIDLVYDSSDSRITVQFYVVTETFVISSFIRNAIENEALSTKILSGIINFLVNSSYI